MICNLCRKEKKLIKKSHIIPRSLINKFVNPDKKGYKKLIIGTDKSSNAFDSNYEPNILCLECEQIIGKNEDYLYKFIFDGLSKKNHLVINQNTTDAISVSNVNYQKLKLAIISIVWRSSISKINNHESITLGSEVKEKMREMIWEADPGNTDEFPVAICSFGHLTQFEKATAIYPPYISEKDGQITYWIIIGKLMLCCFIKPEKSRVAFEQSWLTENGDLNIVKLPYRSAKKIVNEIIQFEYLK